MTDDGFFGTPTTRTARPATLDRPRSASGTPSARTTSTRLASPRTTTARTARRNAASPDAGRVEARASRTSSPRSPRSAPARNRTTASPSRRPAPARRGAAAPPRPSRPAPAVRTARAPRPVVQRAPRRVRPQESLDQLARRTARRMVAFVVVIALLVVAVGLKLAAVQVAAPDTYVAYGESQYNGFRTLPAWRGAIYDRDGRAFALSVAVPRLVADPSQVADDEAAARALATILDRDADELEGMFEKAGDRYEIVADDLSDAQVAQIEELGLAGISFEDRYVRTNPTDQLASSVIGRALADGEQDDGGHQGLSGIERQFDALLKGTPGRQYYERDVAGRTIAGGEERIDAAKPGTDLFLTLDQTLQYEAERALAAQVEATGSESATAVIMRPSTGEILAMASVAVDDDGDVANTGDNRAVTAVFEPGSINKVFSVAGAMEEGIVAPDTVLDVPDTIQLYDRPFSDHDPHAPAAWSVTDILVTSSNVGTIKIAQQLGEAGVDRYLRSFGFGTTTGLGFPSEEDGIMKSLDDWSGVDIGAIPIGQGISVTALQMLAAYNALANGGMYIAPKLVGTTDAGGGQVIAEQGPSHRVISEETSAAMRAMLTKVVTDGTGQKAAVPGYDVAGKTGTARTAHGIDAEDGYLDESGRYQYEATFVGFVDGADLSALVTFHKPQTSIFGGDVAAPVFSHLIATALRRYQVPPPELLESSRTDVPELSSTAREIEGEDVTGGRAPAAG